MSYCTLNLRFHKLQTSTNAVIINVTDGMGAFIRERFMLQEIQQFFFQSLFSYTFSSFSDFVHQLEPKKCVYEFLVTSGCLISRKVL